MSLSRKFRAHWRSFAAVFVTVGLLAACTPSSEENSGGSKVDGGTATFVQGTQKIDWIFPFVDAAHQTVVNTLQLQVLMYRPLYWLGKDGQPVVDPERSLAEEPVWSDGNTTVSVPLKDWKWSDGSAVDVSNVAFWMGLLEAGKENFAGYSPGTFPDNLESTEFDEASNTVVFHLKSAVSPEWFNANQLTYITPLPKAWDLIGSGAEGTCSSLDQEERAASCPAVLEYLLEQNADTKTYATNPLWQVVNGPWTLESFESTGQATFIPNDTYSGPVKPTLDKLVIRAVTGDDAMFNLLRSGEEISVGYAPLTSLPKSEDGTSGESPVEGYDLVPVYYWGYAHLWLNYNNPESGPLFKQLYIRQALQTAMDRDTSVDSGYNGYGTVNVGPIPLRPENPYVSDVEKENPYDFDVERAKQYLTDNGWTIPSEGPATCTSPGTGEGQCGEGIAEDKELSIKFETFDLTGSGRVWVQFKSDAAKAGIEIELLGEPIGTVIGNAVPCEPSDASCGWQMINGGGNILTPYPTGENLYSTGAGRNPGGYSDPVMDDLIATSLTGDIEDLKAYVDYAATQLPVLYAANAAYPTEMVIDNLEGVTPVSPFLNITPEDWYFVE